MSNNSNMQNSIAKLLDGVAVEWKALGEIGLLIRGSGLQKKDFTETGVPAIHYGQIYTYYGIFATETKSFVSAKLAEKLKKAKYGDILLAGTSENVKDVMTPLGWLGGEIVFSGDMFAFRPSNLINTKYLTYFLQTTPFQKFKEKYANGTKVIRISSEKFLTFKIPIPPLHVQTEIVRILDTFTELTAELTVELTARKKKYDYYLNKLLTFKEEEVEWKLIGEFASLKRGIRVTRNQLSQKNGYEVYQNSLTPLGYYEKANTKENTTFIISAGAAGEIGYSTEKFWAADDCFYFECSKDLLSRYLFYVLKNKQEYISSQVRRSSIPRLPRTIIEKLKIPIPPLKEQARIVEILDKFDAITNSLTEGLPREIELRQKQYEYYRNLLLNFPKVEDK